jgi:hypothetical protein
MNQNNFTAKAAAILLVTLLVVAATLRIWQLDRPALWEDDYFNLDRGLMSLGAMFHAQKYSGPTDTFHDYQPPLYYGLLHAALALSKSTLAARLVSFSLGMLALFGLYKAGGSLFGGRAGLFALMLAALSLFHIDSSRSIKTYSVYFCASVWAVYFLNEALRRRTFRLWAAYVPCAAAMVYSSFMGVPGLAGQLLFGAIVLGWDCVKGKPGWKSGTVGFIGASLTVLVICLPWVGAVTFIREMFYNPGVDPLASLSLAKVGELAEGFLNHVFAMPPWLWAGLPLLAAAGVCAATTGGALKSAGLLFLWAGLPAVAVLTSKTEMNAVLSTRHFFNVYGLLILFGGYGADAISRLLFGKLFRAGTGFASLVFGTALCLGVSVYGLFMLPQYYQRSISFDRDFYYWLYGRHGMAETLDVQGWKRSTKRFAGKWYLPGLFVSAGDMFTPAYRRMLVVENSFGKGSPTGVPQTLWHERFALGPFGGGASLVGMVNRSPLVVAPDKEGSFVYSDDYSGFAIHQDAFSLQNASTDTRLGVLIPSSWAKPGTATYRFALPQSVETLQVEALLRGVLYKRHPASPSKAALEVWAGPNPEAFKLVGVISIDDFTGQTVQGCESLEEVPLYGACSRMAKQWDITSLVGNGRDFYVSVRLLPGEEEGYLFADDFGLKVRTRSGSFSKEDARWLELSNLLSNNRVQPWQPGAAALDGLFAFAARDELVRPELPLGSPVDLLEFQTRYPELMPVHVLKDDTGAPAVFFFDLPLRLSPRDPEFAMTSLRPFDSRGLTLSGRLHVPSLLVADQRVDIPIVAPAGSTLMLNPGGRGMLIWSPDFSKDVFDKLDFSSSENLRPTPDADNDGGLTCREERPCHFTARFVSAFPVKRVRLEWYPRVVADPTGKNMVRLSYSTDDGKTFKQLERYIGEGSGNWSETFKKHATTLYFNTPVNHFMLKAELTGEDAQLWSHRRVVDKMWAEFDLDARSLKPFQIPEGQFRLGLIDPSVNDVTLRLQDKPVPIFDSIKDWR